MESIKEEIEKLKKEKRAIILAHYYVPGEVQEIADYIGDSYFLSKKARETEAEMILFAGVSFMGESAKILNPERTVLLPDAQADCPMAHMASREKIREMREKYEDLAVVCYINSTAELKTMSDVCVTSSNAVDIVKKLPNKNIFFIPDGNLGAYVAAQVPEKNIIVNEGYCPVHREIQEEDVKNARKEHPKASVLVHPECVSEVVRTADFVGSTSEIIQYACQSEKKRIPDRYRGRRALGFGEKMSRKSLLSGKTRPVLSGYEKSYPGEGKRCSERRKIPGKSIFLYILLTSQFSDELSQFTPPQTQQLILKSV